MSRTKALCKAPFSVVLDREWPGYPGIWVGTCAIWMLTGGIWKNFVQGVGSSPFNRVHAKGVVFCERTCFCLLSAFYETLPSENLSKNHVFTENPYWRLLRTLLRSTYLCGIFYSGPKNPEGPKIEKIQDFAPGLKFSSDQSQIEIFNRD